MAIHGFLAARIAHYWISRKRRPRPLHIGYLHTLMRYVRDRFDNYSGATENPKTDISWSQRSSFAAHAAIA